MFNRKFSSNIRRKKRMIISTIILLVVCLGLGYATFTTNLSINGTLNVSKYDQTLYGVFEKEAKVGTYVKEYTDAHHDSMAGVGTEKIYHWYAPSTTAGNTLATEIIDKNNVIFANHCWQMIRTTDTGGVKMVYNGEPENNQCLNTRDNHVGFGTQTMQYLRTDYYYGTSYTYDEENGVFFLDGNITTGTINQGEYTCKSTLSTGTCSTLYFVDSLNSGVEYFVLPLNNNYHYSIIGKSKYNSSDNSYTYTGYMYNNVYPISYANARGFYVQNSSTSIDTSNYYSDSIDYNNITTNQYTLVNPIQISTLSDYNSLVGKYIINQSGISSSQAGYIVSVDNETIYYKALLDGDLATSMMIGNTYINNGNGTYTIENPTLVKLEDWYSGNYSSYINKYFCFGNDGTCSNIAHITNGYYSNKYYSYYSSDDTYKFSSNINYDGNNYTLADNVIELWDIPIVLDNISTHHYTCFNNQNVCDKINYVSYYSGGKLYYIKFNSLPNIEAVLQDMLKSTDVNQKNSIVKEIVDTWYQRYLMGYTNKLEDTIFCNDRSIFQLGGYNPNGGNISSDLIFNGSLTTSISCINETDKFSVENQKAKLIYKIGLMTTPEAKLFNNKIIIGSGSDYYLLSPRYFYSVNNTIIMGSVDSAGQINSSGMGYIYIPTGVRPVISLKPGTEYVSGGGSMSDPYVVE